MPNVKYTDSATFRCLENLRGITRYQPDPHRQGTLLSRPYLFNPQK